MNLELTKEQVKAALTGIDYKYVNVKDDFGTHKEIKVRYKGKWRTLGRTDLFDDIRTVNCSQKVYKDPVSHFIKKARFGARVDKTGFYVIDSISDG